MIKEATYPTWFAVTLISISVIGCGNSGPYSMVKVTGSVKYEGGSLIDANRIIVNFLPQVEAVDAKTHPLLGRAELNVATGEFDLVTSHKYGDGVVKGKHKVFLSIDGGVTPAEELVRAEYLSADATPLTFDTSEGVLQLSIPRL